MAESKIQQVVPDSGAGYCKMPDGTLIQWGSKLFSNINVNNAWGSLFETNTSMSFGAWPINFIDTPCTTFSTLSGQPIFVEGISNNSNQNIGNTYLWSAMSKTNVTVTISYIGIGRWK